MTQNDKGEAINIYRIRELIANRGFEIVGQDESSIHIRDLESGISITSALEKDVLFNTVACTSLEDDRISPEMMAKMLDAENGIATSSFQIYKTGKGKSTIALSNFCKLQELGADDEDDIMSCLSFLLVDVLVARNLLRM